MWANYLKGTKAQKVFLNDMLINHKNKILLKDSLKKFLNSKNDMCSKNVGVSSRLSHLINLKQTPLIL